MYFCNHNISCSRIMEPEESESSKKNKKLRYQIRTKEIESFMSGKRSILGLDLNQKCKGYQGMQNVSNLLNVIELAKIRCFHEKHSKTGAHLFRESGRQFDQTYFVTSQSNGGLLLIVPFAEPVKVRSICIIAKYENPARPKLMRLFINTQNVDFSITEQESVQQFSLSPNLEGLQPNEVDTNKFSRVRKLMIHFQNSDMQKMDVSYIQINGEISNIKGQLEQVFQTGSPIPQEYRDSIQNNIRQQEIAKNQFADKQAKILTKENFLTVFTKHQIYQLQINWQIFQNGFCDDSTKRHAMNKINILMEQAVNYSKEFKVLDDFIMRLNLDQKRIDHKFVNNIASNYFKKLFPKCKIDVYIKYVGIQLGAIVRIYPYNQKPITYYVKTHSDGLAQQKNQVANIVNPIELMVYKILENLGIGCESHLFGKDLKNFQIATKDAGYDGAYLSYKQLQENAEYSHFLNSKDFSNGIFCIDLLSRILRLTDLQTNSGNFGFVQKIDGWQVRVIDFRSPPRGDYGINKYQFKGFLQGKTQVQYSDKVITNLFEKYKDQLQEIAKGIFVNQFKYFNDIVEKSQKIVLSTINSNFNKDISEKDFQGMLRTLSLYKKAVKRNFGIFCQQLQINPLANGIEIGKD